MTAVATLGLGIDAVDVAAFARQLAEPHSAFVERTFTAQERRDAAAGPGDDAARLAARYAAKEALVKAWSVVRTGRPPALASVDLREIEVVLDGWGRPRLALHGDVAAAVAALEADARVHVSLSHDGPSAVAVALIEGGVPGDGGWTP